MYECLRDIGKLHGIWGQFFVSVTLWGLASLLQPINNSGTPSQASISFLKKKTLESVTTRLEGSILGFTKLVAFGVIQETSLDIYLGNTGGFGDREGSM